MKPARERRYRKWILWIVFCLILFMAGYVGLLANPHLLMRDQHSIGNLTFYSDQSIPAELVDLANCVYGQLVSTEIFDEHHKSEVYLCQEQSLYLLFSRMCFVPASVPAYNLSLLNVSFVSLPRLHQIQANGIGLPKYSVFEGNVCHGITHELIHDFMVEKIGYVRNRNLPRWKREGYAEYHASLSRLQSDNKEYLRDRIRIIQEANGLSDHVVEYFSWRTVAEYLFEVKAYSLEEFLDDTVAYESALRDMLEWYAALLPL